MSKWTVEQHLTNDGVRILDGEGNERGAYQTVPALASALCFEMQELARLRVIVEPLEKLLEEGWAVNVWLPGKYTSLSDQSTTAMVEVSHAYCENQYYKGDTLADALAQAVAAKREAENEQG